MASKAVKLPVIDFSHEDLKPGTPTWSSIKIEVTNALEEFGCLVALYDKVPTETRKALFESAKELFNLPLETRVQNSSSTFYNGYVSQAALQSMVVDELSLPGKVESFESMMWPQGNSKFSKTVRSYSEQLSELDKIVRRMVLESLGLEKYMDEHMNSTDVLIRFMKYIQPPSNEKTLGLATHTDKSTLGILTQNETDGLQLLTKDGQWIEMNFYPNSFVVVVGDVLHGWTNGRVHAPSHRVMLTDSDTRYSVGLFTNTKPGYIVKAPEELVDKQHPLLYKPFENPGLFAFFNTKPGQYCDNTLKGYCGV